MILNFPWWHLIAAGFLVGAGWNLAAWVAKAIRNFGERNG